MGDSRLFIEIGIDNDGKLSPIDQTPYERWDTDITTHAVIERVLDSEDNTIEMRAKVMVSEREYEYMRHTDPYELRGDGLYTYQKLLMPSTSHNGDNACYYSDGKFYLNGAEVDFDTVWEAKANQNNIFWFDDQVFSIYNLIECFVLKEEDRLSQVFKNGCKIGCSGNTVDSSNADFLASAVFVLLHLIKNKKYTEALAILNQLNTCNGLCKDVRGQLKGCGCG